ncbi:NUDIX domain-containing protein [Flavobacteriaceae bacterium F89]|uniref:NUDIX domain-containing protein n=1 Tax=Cerina litoralis TaxID=2874477 RepID=A0AAE3EXV7_9FLAO|nr:NUDIX domain-containing protein [Cerina litoralis]MCG2462908.1 NUDIX domain-containing protein [Cerina litoralis]
MIIKKRVYKADKKANPFIGVLLFFISILLLLVTGPIGFIYGLFYKFIQKGIVGLGEYTLKVAVSIDQLGNVIMQHLLDQLWIKKDGYRFGNRDETISSAIGRNKKLGTLTGFGRAIDKFLDRIDPNHSLNSIDYYIEPTTQIVEKVAWILLVDQRILSTRSKGKKTYDLPGGKKKLGETDTQTLIREIKEKLTVNLDPTHMEFVGIFEARAVGRKPEILVRKTCYYASYNGTLAPATKTAELVWLSYEDREMVSEVDRLIFDFLKGKEMLG